jgi:hypothetical protein
MISSRPKHIQSFTGGTISLTKGNSNKIAYLVRQGQQEVLEEDSGGCNCVILPIIDRSLAQRRENDENWCLPPLRSW